MIELNSLRRILLPAIETLTPRVYAVNHVFDREYYGYITMVSESDTMVKLPLLGELTYREWHAFVEGVYCGAEDVQETEYTKEKHYWRIGYLGGKYVLP